MARKTVTAWITETEAGRLAELEQPQIRALAEQGLLVRRDLPGVRTRILRESVTKLIASWQSQPQQQAQAPAR